MKKLLLVLLVGFLYNTVVAQTTTEKTENVKIEQTVKKCSDDKTKKCCSKDAKADNKPEDKSCSGKKASCTKDKVKESTSKKCSKGDACCSKTGKKVADCDKKKQGCCKADAKPSR